MNSIVGLKPTIGLLSRSGIVPISSTLDTPGPMTRNVSDNAILLSAMVGEDPLDPVTIGKSSDTEFYKSLPNSSLKAIRLGALSAYMERDSVYRSTIESLQRKNVEIVLLNPERIQMEGFVSILNIDMKNDLPSYLQKYGNKDLPIENVQDVIAFNQKDTSLYAPYGQGRLEGILNDKTTKEELLVIKQNLQKITRKYFDDMMDEYNLDAVLSINNYNAGYAAAAKYPALTVPMGYRDSGQPVNLTFIGKPFSEEKLLQIGYAFEKLRIARIPPEDFKN
jgi:amidase